MNGPAFPAGILVTALACLASVVTDLYGPWGNGEPDLFPMLAMMAAGLLLIAASGDLRRQCLELAAAPLAEGRGWEVAAVTLWLVLLPCAAAGAEALWHWHRGAEAGLEALLRHRREIDPWARAWVVVGPAGLVVYLLATPVVEELFFRGLLLRAWAREWGWAGAVATTSAASALYHPDFAAAFAAALILACLSRRAGTVRAPLVAHAAAFLLAAPLATGPAAVPRVDADLATLGDWWFPIACFLLYVAVMPYYVWFAVRGHETRADDMARLRALALRR